MIILSLAVLATGARLFKRKSCPDTKQCGSDTKQYAKWYSSGKKRSDRWNLNEDTTISTRHKFISA